MFATRVAEVASLPAKLLAELKLAGGPPIEDLSAAPERGLPTSPTAVILEQALCPESCSGSLAAKLLSDESIKASNQN